MTGVIYARYSSDSQREESIDAQLRECTAFAQAKGITILSTYIDRAFSATTDKRPEFQLMIKDAGKKLFDYIIVLRLDRFARNRYDSAHYKAILRKSNVKIISATETINDDASGIILESVLEGMAEYYSVELSQKVRRGLNENAMKGKYNGGGLPWGYMSDNAQNIIIDPSSSMIITQVFELYANGMRMQEIADSFNSKGIRSKKGNLINVNYISRILNNRRYTGEYSHSGITKEGAMPALVSKELFELVQAKLIKNRKAPARAKAVDEQYLLTTKLFCGKCGALITGESGTSKTGKLHHYYRCFNTRKQRTCDKKNVRKNWIENIVISETMAMLQNKSIIDDLTNSLVKAQENENTALPVLKQQLAETEKAISNILNAIQQGVFTASTKGRLDELEQQKSNIETGILQEQIKKPVFSKEQMLLFIQKFAKINIASMEEKQILIDTFVNSIYLYDDKIIFTFNYKDGSKTVSLNDINCSDILSLGAPYKANNKDAKRSKPLGISLFSLKRADFFICKNKDVIGRFRATVGN